MAKKSKSHTKSWAVNALRKSYEAHMASLPNNQRYDLLEELSSGEIITHLIGASLDELKAYVRKTFINIAPPSFMIRPTLFTTNAVAASQHSLKSFWRKLFND